MYSSVRYNNIQEYARLIKRPFIFVLNAQKNDLITKKKIKLCF